MLVSLLLILVYVSIAYLILYLFQKWVMPIDQKIVGIVLFILFAILVIYVLTGGNLVFWRGQLR